MDEVPSINQIVSRRRKKNQKPQAYSPSDPAHTITQVRHIAEHIKLEALGANAKRNLDRTILRPSKTICGSGNQTGARIFDHTQPEVVKVRSLTLKEHGILQGFPEEYKWVFEKKEDAWTVVGNAVCPPVAEAVIRGIF
jgi:site-specific DNA-cytosine methylase